MAGATKSTFTPKAKNRANGQNQSASRLKQPLSKETVSESGSESDDISNSSGEDTSSSDGEAEAPRSSLRKSSTGSERKSSPHVRFAPGVGGSDEEDIENRTSSDDPSSSSEEELGSAPTNLQGAASSKKRSANPTEIPVKRPRYTAPEGFTHLKQSSDQTGLSLASDESTQLWHITFPKTVDLQGLQTIALQPCQDGSMRFSIGGDDYSFTEQKLDAADGQSGSVRRLLLSDPSNGKYRASSREFEKTIHIRKVVPLPSIGHNPLSSGKSTISHVAARSALGTEVRQQPKGLRMRYLPPGYGPGRAGNIGSESSSEDGDEGMADAGSALPTFRRPTSQQKELTRVPVSTIHSTPESGKQKKKKKKKRSQEAQDQHLTNGNALSAAEPSSALESQAKEVIDASRSKGKKEKKGKPAQAPATPQTNGHSSASKQDQGDDDADDSFAFPSSAIQSDASKMPKTAEERAASAARKEARRLKRLEKADRRKSKDSEASREAVAA